MVVGGCLGASITFNAPIDDVNVNFRAGLPDETAIPSVPCATQSVCDALESEKLTYTCTAGICDPDPIVVSQTLSDVDFGVLSSDVLSALDTIELKRVAYDYSVNSLTVDVGPLEIFWAPEGTASVESPNVMRLGTFPGVPALTTPEGTMTLDAAGNAALSDYVGGNKEKVRFFVRTSVDLEPGDQIPQSVTVQASFLLTIKATGDIL